MTDKSVTGDSLGNGESSEDQQHIPHPWPYLREMFEIAGSKKDSWKMHCKLCLPKRHELLAFKNSPSNLKKHVERKHKNQLERYTNLTSKRLTASDEGPSSKQPKLWETRRVSQASVDKVIIDFVIQGLHPLSVVEQQGFQALILHLQPDVSVMSRGTVKNRVEKAALVMKNNLKTALGKIEFIATTTDCWTSCCRSFIGVTAHWIELQTLKRRCAALACKQLKGSHTFSVLASALNEIHTEFNICEKITRTTTDNGSNFVKAFRVYGHVDKNNLAPAAESGEVDDEVEEEDDEEMGNADNEFEFVEAEAILDEDDSSPEAK